MLKVEVILGIVASAIAILAFIARAYANIRKGHRIKRYSSGISAQSEAELRRLREEMEAAQEMTAQKRAREKGGG